MPFLCRKKAMKFDLLFLTCMLHIVISNGNKDCISKPPHIIFIYADDLGWNDVSFHGSPEIPTPNIDALAMNGILLNSYYGEYMCTPSRAALLTGKYPFRLGLQHYIIKAGEASALPLTETTMPQHLKTLGYETHMIGKWHLGYMKKEYTPTFRGFDTFFGYYNGILDYYDYTSQTLTDLRNPPTFVGIDLQNGTNVVRDFRGTYATDVFTEKAEDIISNHDTSKPLFLYLAHLAVHSGNRNNRLQAPPEVISKFKCIKNLNRRIQAAVTSVLDESVGAIFKALYERDMLQNSIIVFASDNGGQVEGLKGGYSSNYPLRSKKTTLWEGGIRVPALIWSPLFHLQQPRVSEELMHVSDWLPTFFEAAGGSQAEMEHVDGLSMWQSLMGNLPSPRTELPFIDDVYGISALRKGDWKIVDGNSPEGYDDWYGPKGTEYMGLPKSMEQWVFKDGSIVRDILVESGLWIVEDVDQWYEASPVTCKDKEEPLIKHCSLNRAPSLFNIKDDPCEINDLAEMYPEMVHSLMDDILVHRKEAVPSQSKPSDPRANPMCYGFAHVPWMDPEHACQNEKCNFLD